MAALGISINGIKLYNCFHGIEIDKEEKISN